MMPVKSNSFCLLDDDNCSSDEGDWGDACEEAMTRGLLYASSCLLLLCVSESIACYHSHFFDFGGARGASPDASQTIGLSTNAPRDAPRQATSYI